MGIERTTSGLALGGHGFDSHRGQKIFSLPRVVPCFPLLGPSGLFMGLSSTIIYTSELRRNPPDVGVTSGQKPCTKTIYIVLQTFVGLF